MRGYKPAPHPDVLHTESGAALWLNADGSLARWQQVGAALRHYQADVQSQDCHSSSWAGVQSASVLDGLNLALWLNADGSLARWQQVWRLWADNWAAISKSNAAGANLQRRDHLHSYVTWKVAPRSTFRR